MDIFLGRTIKFLVNWGQKEMNMMEPIGEEEQQQFHKHPNLLHQLGKQLLR